MKKTGLISICIIFCQLKKWAGVCVISYKEVAPMKDYVTPSMDIEVFDAHSDIILTSGQFEDGSANDPFTPF